MNTPPPAPVFATLSRYGISQRDIARGLKISQPAISHWTTGRRHLPPSVAQDLEDLLALIAEYLQQGRKARDALQAWRPRSVITEGGAWQSPPVAISSGPIDISPMAAKPFLEARSASAREGILLRDVLDQLEAYRERELSQLTVADILQIRNLAMALQSLTSMMAQRKGQVLQQSGEGKS
jgi:transcriptional regulator with XRE-family HTH domain